MRNFEIPEFTEFVIQRPDLHIETQRLIVEILGSIESAQREFEEGNFFAKALVMGGKKAFMLRYRERRSGKYFPVAFMSYDEDEEGNVVISEIQGARERSAYRVYATFKVFPFFLKIVEENFIKHGKKVQLSELPVGIEFSSYGSRALDRYATFREGLQQLHEKYGL